MWPAVRTAVAKGLLASPAAESRVLVPAARRFATAAATRASPRPRGALFAPRSQCAEGHQTRSFAGTTAAGATKKPAVKAKAAATSKKTTIKKTANAKKPVKKLAAKKKTAKVVAKKPAKPRKVPTKEELTKLQVRGLKKVALLKEPAKLPEHPWILYVTENTKGVKSETEGRIDFGKVMSDLSQSFKNLSTFEQQRLRDTATKNSETNAAAYKAWVESHPAKEVAEANRARLHLKRLGSTKRRTIQDDRLPKRPHAAFALFTKSRWSTGNYHTGGGIAEAAKSIAAEWKALSPSERQPFEDSAKADAERYEKEVESVLGRSISKSPSPSSP